MKQNRQLTCDRITHRSNTVARQQSSFTHSRGPLVQSSYDCEDQAFYLSELLSLLALRVVGQGEWMCGVLFLFKGLVLCVSFAQFLTESMQNSTELTLSVHFYKMDLKF